MRPSLAPWPRAHARWARAALRACATLIVAGLAGIGGVAGIGGLGALAGCTTDSTPITPYPIPVDMDGGVVMVKLGIDGIEGTMPAVIDTMSPLTVVDGVAMGDPPPRPERRRRELTIYSAGQLDDAGMPVSVPQARFGGIDTFDLHPCAGADAAGSGPCQLGFDGATREIHAILGADLWSRVAIRFSFAKRLISLFPDISGDNLNRALLCEAVFPAPFYGGGTLVISGAEVSFIGYRLAVGACLLAEAEASGAALLACPPTDDDPGPRPTLPRAQGAVSALFLISTGLPISLVSESFHARYLAACAALGVACDTTLGAPETLHIASGPITVRRTTITNLALVSEYSNERGPCQELYTNAFMLRCVDLPEDAECCGDSKNERRDGCRDSTELLCPCEYKEGDEERRTFCRSGAVAAVDHVVPVAVVPDTDPLLQALRDEIRPALPELDGILAPSALESLEIDVDYPNNRMIVRDPSPVEQPDAGLSVYATRPAVINSETRDAVITYCGQ
jgi:hypothetical protein